MTRILPILVLLTGIAHADEEAEARKLFRIGSSAYSANMFEAAALNFERAWELYKAPEIAFAGAQAHRLQYQADLQYKHLVRAIELFEAYIAAVPKGGKRRDALAHLERLRDVRGRQDAAGAKLVVEKEPAPSIYVSTSLDGALITIDGKAVARYTAIELERGDHVVAVSADGFVPAKRTVTVTKGLAMVPIELAPQPATLVVHSAPGARVLVDGRELAGTHNGAPIDPGKRLVTVYARGRVPVTRSLELRPGQDLTLDVPLVPTLRRRSVRWVGGGAAALLGATLVTGTVWTFASFSAASLRDSPTPLEAGDTRRYLSLRDRRDTYRSATAVLGGATVATVGIALWLYYFDRPAPEDLGRPAERSREDGFAPLVTSAGAGIAYGRSW